MSDEAIDYLSYFHLLDKEQALGLHKGICIDNEDPWGLGRIRVWIYGMHGDFTKIPKEAIPWSDPVIPLAGAFTPPPKWARVWVAFDAGYKYTPVYLGFWYAVPNGTGKLAFDSRKGSEVPAEAWHFNRLIPEATLLARSPEGNAVWLEQKFISDKHVASSINLMDTGGKGISIRSFHPDTESVEAPFKGDAGDSIQKEQGEKFNDPIRSGTDNPEQATGSIEFDTQGLKRVMHSDGDSFTCESVSQTDKDGKVKAESQMIDGDVLLKRAESALFLMSNSAMFLYGANGVFANTLRTPPRRYDEETENSVSGQLV